MANRDEWILLATNAEGRMLFAASTAPDAPGLILYDGQVRHLAKAQSGFMHARWNDRTPTVIDRQRAAEAIDKVTIPPAPRVFE